MPIINECPGSYSYPAWGMSSIGKVRPHCPQCHLVIDMMGRESIPPHTAPEPIEPVLADSEWISSE